MSELSSFFEDQTSKRERRDEVELVVSMSADGGFKVEHDEEDKKPTTTTKEIPKEDQFAIPMHPTKRRAITPQPQQTTPQTTPPPGPLTPQPSTLTQQRSVVNEMLMHRIEGILELENESERIRFDIAARPDVASIEAYNELPVESFGEAFLRGQGWKPGDPIGMNPNFKPINPIEPKKRPGMRLGLGATQETADLQKRLQALRRKGIDILESSTTTTEEEEVKKEDVNEFPRGTLVAVIGGGRYDGFYAVVKDSQAGQVLVRLMNANISENSTTSTHQNLGAQEVWMIESDVSKVDPLKLDREHEARTFWEKCKKDKSFMESPFVMEILKEHKKKVKQQEEKLRLQQKQQQQEEEEERKKKIEESKKKLQQRNQTSSKRKEEEKRKESWIEAGLVVRIISKKFGDSLYLKKAKIIDVMESDYCILEMLEGKKIVEHVRQCYLETVIPQIGGSVLVLSGERMGLTATLLGKKQQPQQQNEPIALVQFHSDLQVSQLPFDNVCSYLGENRL